MQMEKQISDLGSAIVNLRQDHQGQMECMKAFYDEKINQIRKDVESQTRQDMQSSS